MLLVCGFNRGMPPKRELRKDDGVKTLIREVFDEIKSDLISSIESTLISELEVKIQSSVELVIKGILEKHDQEIEKLDANVKMLQQQVITLKEQNHMVSLRCEENEQYGRRQCLRIDGIHTKENESSLDVLNVVKGIIADHELDIPDSVLDRAHRIGPVIGNDDERRQSVIVKFTSFRHRTIFYKMRKTFVNIKVRLDLTRMRYNLFKSAMEYVEGCEEVDFVFVDINCKLKIRFKDGSVKPFGSMEDLSKLVSK